MSADQLLGIVQRLMERVLRLERDRGVVPRWATVTAVGPLRVRLDGEADPLETTPQTLVTPLFVGDRVRVALEGRRAVVTGRNKGDRQVGSVRTRRFSIAGAGSYSPPSNLIFAHVRGVGGGGAGGGTSATASDERACGAGGSAGGGFEAWIAAADLPATINYTVGAGGVGGTGAGQAGGDTVFPIVGSTLRGYGGVGGASLKLTSLANNTGPSSATPGDVDGYGNAGVRRGGAGSAGWWFCITANANPAIVSGGAGGGSFLVPGTGRANVADGTGATNGDAAGTDSWGAGGGGAASNRGNSSRTGGNGHAGVILITEYLSD